MLEVSSGRQPADAGLGKRNRRGLSLRLRLSLLVVACIVPLLGFLLYYQYSEYREDTAALGVHTLELARTMSRLVDGELQARIAALETLTTSRALTTDDLARFRDKAEAVIALQIPGASIELVTEDGREIVNTSLRPDAPVPTRGNLGSLQRAFATGDPQVSSLYQSVTGKPVVAIDVPAKDALGKIVYVVSLHPNLDTFVDLIRRQRLPPTWVVSIFDRNGVNIARVPNGDKFRGSKASDSFFAALQSRSEGILDTTSLENIALLTTFAHSEQFSWAVALGVPRAELVDPIVAGARTTAIVGAVMLGFSLMLAVFASRRIAGPFRALRRLAAIGEDDALPDLAPTGLPEADEVAEALHSAEEERRRSRAAERVLRAGIESIPEGIAIYDAEDRLVMCNDGYRNLFVGRAHHVVVGARFEDMVRAAASGRPGAALGRTHEDWISDRLRDHRDPSAAAEQELPDGRWVLVRNRALADGGLVGLRVEITALKLAEQALRGTEARFRDVVESVPNGILIVNGRGAIEMVNAQTEYIFGYTRAELIGQPVEMLLPQRIRAAHPALRDRFFTEPRARLMGVGRDLQGCRKDGSEFPLEVGLSPIETDSGMMVLASIVDIADRRRTEEQLRQSQKMEAIGNLTGGMAHDFNNLLGIVILNLDLARGMVEAEGELSETIKEAHDAAWRGADLTRRLLAFARRQPLRPARIDVSALVADTVRLLRRLLGEDIEVTADLAEDVWPVTADPAQLESALANLANNARDAMPRGGRLIVTTANCRLDDDYAASHDDVTVGDYVMIEVTDTGTGMSPEIRAQIFEPFFTTKEAGKGTGLGLSMVFGFMRQSGGHINVYSEPGAGTTFRLYLPRSAVEGPVVETAASAPSAMGAGETVLVVEDNASVRRAVLRQLRQLGYVVVECERAVAALAVLQHQPVDLLFTDIVMPGGLDGVELARLAHERWPDLKIVLTSGFPQARVDENGDLLASFQLLSKPYSREQLSAALREALDG
jgi:PAS domain S-box-containing protein